MSVHTEVGETVLQHRTVSSAVTVKVKGNGQRRREQSSYLRSDLGHLDGLWSATLQLSVSAVGCYLWRKGEVLKMA